MRPFSPRQREALEIVSAGRFYPGLAREPDGWHARWFAIGGDNPWVDEFVREAAATPLSRDAENYRYETVHDAWIAALKSDTGLVKRDDAECEAFAADLAAWHGAGDDSARSSTSFRLEASPGGFSVSCDVPRGLAAYRALGQSAYVFGPLRRLAKCGGGRMAAELSREEAEALVQRGARDLVAAGYRVEGCNLSAEVGASADVEETPAKGRKAEGFRARLRIHVDGETVSLEELRFLVEQRSSMVFFRNRWIEVDRGILKEALRALEKSGVAKLARMEAVSFVSGIGRIGRLDVSAATAGGRLRALMAGLGAAAGGACFAPTEPPPGFSGELRAYQARGAAWMKFLADNGFGALLADDMGLGKTAQAIAWMLMEGAGGDAEHRRSFLVVAPLTLLANWRHELEKFAPGLSVYTHHGDARRIEDGFRRAVREADVTLTSYALLSKDFGEIGSVEWTGLVLDEAQMAKNPDTQVARAARAVPARFRVALTGTPVENSVQDLWSIEEALNPGLLGDRRSFHERFARPVAERPDGPEAGRLRRALEPFVLRRLKDDAGVCAEIGPKREVREYCMLSDGERAEYEAALAAFRAGERGRGDVFALITRLKLVCDGMAGLVDGELCGGKFQRLAELLESVFEAGESALVFTQYAKAAEALRKSLERRLGMRVPCLHGGMSAGERAAQAQTFERLPRPGAFVLSLRAGGLGLNLVKASRAIHYDRWWNPAVEDQATGRIHRIGQTRRVFSHLMIAEGTLEERVDAMLQAKTAVARSAVASGEAFLANLPAEEFARVVGL